MSAKRNSHAVALSGQGPYLRYISDLKKKPLRALSPWAESSHMKNELWYILKNKKVLRDEYFKKMLHEDNYKNNPPFVHGIAFSLNRLLNIPYKIEETYMQAFNKAQKHHRELENEFEQITAMVNEAKVEKIAEPSMLLETCKENIRKVKDLFAEVTQNQKLTKLANDILLDPFLLSTNLQKLGIQAGVFYDGDANENYIFIPFEKPIFRSRSFDSSTQNMPPEFTLESDHQSRERFLSYLLCVGLMRLDNPEHYDLIVETFSKRMIDIASSQEKLAKMERDIRTLSNDFLPFDTSLYQKYANKTCSSLADLGL